MKVCALLLAAGASSRLGRPKQLLEKEGRSLLQLSIETALVAELDPVFVVLGAREAEIRAQIRQQPVQLIYNPDWQEGIGSSIREGIKHIMEAGSYSAVVIMLCDQLLISAAHLQSLVKAYQQQQIPVVATSYQDQAGVPALFDQSFFPHLKQLSGDTGARKLISQHRDKVQLIQYEAAGVDIDTAEDALRAGLT
ncbi:4-diphosphocytidyl-2c-methyl-d-erythritol synthase [Flammeovirgaceae bacterium 311]|nr:4-diphosphocytidyl-2c-methyl-d-erythritol synthase [Flammeovirgaceae bacterium 311]